MRNGKVAPLSIAQFTVEDVLQHQQDPKPISGALQSTQNMVIPKLKLHWAIFLLNISWMVISLYFSIYYIFSPLSPERHLFRGVLAAASLFLILMVAIFTFYHIVTFKQLIRLMFLLDNVMVASISAMIVFINLILIFDDGHNWHYPMIEAVFTTIIFFYSTMVRVLLVYMHWQKWRIIVFKLHLFVNAIMFMFSGVYFVFIDWSYTEHKIKWFDNQVHQYMVLFYFTMFGWVYEMYRLTSDLDYTGDLKFVYRMKSMDENRFKRKKVIIQQKKETFKSIRTMFALKVENLDFSDHSNAEVLEK